MRHRGHLGSNDGIDANKRKSNHSNGSQEQIQQQMINNANSVSSSSSVSYEDDENLYSAVP
jgi:hypothetical protein